MSNLSKAPWTLVAVLSVETFFSLYYTSFSKKLNIGLILGVFKFFSMISIITNFD